MPSELFANTATTTLTAALSDAVGTSVAVTSSALFPAATNVAPATQFRIKIDTEIMIVTNVSGATWTVTRGAEGSTAATHANAATVTHVVTAGALGVFVKTPAASLRDKYLKPDIAGYETIPRAGGAINTVTTPTSGTLWLMGIALPAGYPVSNITFVSNSATITPANWWFGLWDSSRVQLALTADQTTAAWAANVAKTLAIATTAAGAASSFTTTYEGMHYLGYMMKAATAPQLMASPLGAGIGSLVPILYGSSDTGQTTPPAFPHTANALTVANFAAYGMVN